jgi:hypothetical protein
MGESARGWTYWRKLSIFDKNKNKNKRQEKTNMVDLIPV